MKVCFFGFTLMDYKGEEINEVFFLKKMMDTLEQHGVKLYYLYNQGLEMGLNNEILYHQFDIQAKRLCINKYTKFPFREYEKYTKEELNEIVEFNRNLFYIFKKKNDKNNLIHTAIKCIENVKEYDVLYGIDLFIFWGNSLHSHVLRAYCKKNNKKFINMENGYFRPFTLMVDNKGVNFESSIPRDSKFYDELIIDKERLEKFLDRPEKTHPNLKEVFEYRKKFYEFYGLIIQESALIHNKVCTEDDEIYNQEYIYVPFQLESDSQIIKYSQNVKTMKRLVEVTSEALDKYNVENKQELKIIYKVHPLYEKELDVIDIQSIRTICNNHPNLIFLTEGNNKRLIKESKLVITINSTVGVEALMMYKPVITLGDSFYNVEEIVDNCQSLNDLNQKIKYALEHKVKRDLIDKFLYYLRFDYFVEVYRQMPDNGSVIKVTNKIYSLYKT